MSQTAGRNAAFLEEMGVGAHWTLRRAALAQLESPAELAGQAVPAQRVAAADAISAATATSEAVAGAATSAAAVAAVASPVAAVAVSDDAFAAALADAVSAPHEAVPNLASVGAAAQALKQELTVPVALAKEPAP